MKQQIEIVKAILARTAQAWEVAGSLDQQGVNHEL